MLINNKFVSISVLVNKIRVLVLRIWVKWWSYNTPIHYYVAGSSHTLPHILVYLLGNSNKKIFCRTLLNPKTSLSMVEDVASTTTDSETLTLLSGHSNTKIHYNVAKNLNTPVEILGMYAEQNTSCLTYDPENEYTIKTLCAIASQTGLPQKIYMNLYVNSNDWLVHSLLAANSSISAELFHKLSFSKDRDVSNAIHFNPSLPAFLQHWAEQDKVCEMGQKLPVEWLKEMYLSQTVPNRIQ